MIAALLVHLLASAACQDQGSTTPSVTELGLQPSLIAVPPAGYYDLAWFNEPLVALAVPTDIQNTRIDIVDSGTGVVAGSVPLGERAECVIREMKGLARLADGRLAFADVYEGQAGLPTLTAALHAYNHRDRSLNSLGQLADGPVSMTWSADMSTVFYTAGLKQ